MFLCLFLDVQRWTCLLGFKIIGAYLLIYIVKGRMVIIYYSGVKL